MHHFKPICVQNILARTIGHKGIIAPKCEWQRFGAYNNSLFSSWYNKTENSITFRTNISESPHLMLARNFLEDGVKFNIPLTKTSDGRLELDMRKGNLPARWPSMLYEFGFAKNYSDPHGDNNNKGIELVSYVDKEFDEKCLDLSFAVKSKWFNDIDNEQIDNTKNDINDFVSNSTIKITNRLRDESRINLSDFCRFYKYELGHLGSLTIEKAPYVSGYTMAKFPDSKTRLKYGDRLCENQEISGSCEWRASSYLSSTPTKVFTNECVSLSNNNKKYRCDIGTENTLGFPLSSYYIAMHLLLGNNNFTFIGEYDKGNDYGVFKTFQKEELVVLQENINKTGGISIFVPHGDVHMQIIDTMQKD